MSGRAVVFRSWFALGLLRLARLHDVEPVVSEDRREYLVNVAHGSRVRLVHVGEAPSADLARFPVEESGDFAAWRRLSFCGKASGGETVGALKASRGPPSAYTIDAEVSE